MESAVARREKILRILNERRYEKMANLALELKVSRRTIYSDVMILSAEFPIYTETGKFGGVYVVKDFCYRTKYLTDSQVELLERLLTILNEKDKYTLHSIIITFKRPEEKQKRKN